MKIYTHTLLHARIMNPDQGWDDIDNSFNFIYLYTEVFSLLSYILGLQHFTRLGQSFNVL